MALLPPLQEPQPLDAAEVRVPPVQPTPVNVGLLLAGSSLVLDQATKQLSVQTLIENRLVTFLPEWVPVLSDWGVQLTYNPVGALGFTPARLISATLGDAAGDFVERWFFVLVTALVTLIVVRFLPRAALLRTGVAYGLLLAGAWGNGLDRVFRAPGFPSGRVVDFIATTLPFRYNIADVQIIAGFLMLVLTFAAEERAREADGAVPVLGT